MVGNLHSVTAKMPSCDIIVSLYSSLLLDSLFDKTPLGKGLHTLFPLALS